MKKSLLALAALTAFAGVASAQSSVTLFGVVDLNVRNIKNDTGMTIMSTDGISSSRLGFRGVEDLGGGLRAGFWIEGGLNADIGAGDAAGGGQQWRRRATVSLLSTLGEVRLGRDYVPDFWNHTMYDPFGTNGVGNSVNIFGTYNGATTLVRANNSVGYFLPAMGGIFGQAMVAAGEGVTGNKIFSGRLGYAAGPLSVAVAYGKTESTPSADWTRMNVGGSYNLGFMTLMAQFAQGEGNGGVDDGKKQQLALIGGAIPFGAHTIKASYTQSTGDAAREATQFAAGYQYDLSKRTAVYATFSRVANEAGSKYTAGGGGSALTAGRDSTGIEAGVRHSF